MAGKSRAEFDKQKKRAGQENEKMWLIESNQLSLASFWTLTPLQVSSVLWDLTKSILEAKSSGKNRDKPCRECLTDDFVPTSWIAVRSDRAGTIEKQHIFQDRFQIIIRSSFHCETCDRRNRIGQREMSWSAVDQQGLPRQLVSYCPTGGEIQLKIQFGFTFGKYSWTLCVKNTVDQQGWPRQQVPNCSTIPQGGMLMQFIKQGNVKPPDMLIWHCKDVARQEFDLVFDWLLPSQEHGSGGLLFPLQFPPLAF